MEIMMLSFIDKENEDKNIGVGFEFFNPRYKGVNTSIGIYINEDFNINAYTFKDGEHVTEYGDLSLDSYGKKPRAYFNKLTGGKEQVFMRVNGGKECLVFKRELDLRNEVSSYYSFIIAEKDYTTMKPENEILTNKKEILDFIELTKDYSAQVYEGQMDNLYKETFRNKEDNVKVR